MRALRPVAGLLLAASAVVLWAVGMTVLQPLTEPVGPWPERLAGINTYWARDVRFLAILLVVLGLVLAGGGDRRWTHPALVLGAGAVVADVLLDRADVTGVPATVLLVAGGWAAVGLLAAFLVRRHGRSGRPVHWQRRRALGMAASVAATLVVVAGALRSPTDREPELTSACLAAAGLSLAASVGCALAAASAPGRERRWWAFGLALAGAAGLAVGRLLPPGHRWWPVLALGVVLLTGTTLVSWDRPGGRPLWRRHAMAAVAMLLGLPTVGWLALLAQAALPVGAVLTDGAGNIAVDAMDTDVLFSLAGLLTGLVLGLLLAWPNALGHPAGGQPRPEAPPGPEGPPGPDGPRRASAERR
ncbi:hypothetical protein V6U89_00625 [Micromonospora sp. CPCC 206171]|uniref:hypothetical protein n=1 Tax=Micromonospora sp. CPCC 206171 TaxID=3122405 RepID=UPI002FEF4748